MTKRGRLEGQIVAGLQEIKGLLSGLDQRFKTLGNASRHARFSFLLKLLYLQERARGLEELIAALDA
jgi:hypothetical protein